MNLQIKSWESWTEIQTTQFKLAIWSFANAHFHADFRWNSLYKQVSSIYSSTSCFWDDQYYMSNLNQWLQQFMAMPKKTLLLLLKTENNRAYATWARLKCVMWARGKCSSARVQTCVSTRKWQMCITGNSKCVGNVREHERGKFKTHSITLYVYMCIKLFDSDQFRASQPTHLRHLFEWYYTLISNWR